jgi:hypothetical protein
MGMTLVNGYLAFKYMTDQEMTLSEFTNCVALYMCAEVVEGEGGAVAGATRGARQAAMDIQVARGDPGDLSHALFNGRALGFRASCGEGQCWLCMSMHLVYARHAPLVLI